MGVENALSRLLKYVALSELSLLEHAINTTVDCVSMSFKCTYVLNESSKVSGEIAQMRRLG